MNSLFICSSSIPCSGKLHVWTQLLWGKLTEKMAANALQRTLKEIHSPATLTLEARRVRCLAQGHDRLTEMKQDSNCHPSNYWMASFTLATTVPTKEAKEKCFFAIFLFLFDTKYKIKFVFLFFVFYKWLRRHFII